MEGEGGGEKRGRREGGGWRVGGRGGRGFGRGEGENGSWGGGRAEGKGGGGRRRIWSWAEGYDRKRPRQFLVKAKIVSELPRGLSIAYAYTPLPPHTFAKN